MRILVLGGSRYIGAHAVNRLCERGHEVILFNRGQSAAQSSVTLPQLRQVSGDRARLEDHAAELRRLQAELVLDMRPLGEADARAVVELFTGHIGRLVGISSVDVYQAYDVLRGLVSGSDTATGLEPIPLTEQSPLREKLYPYRLEQPRQPDDPQFVLDDYDKILVEAVYLKQPELPATVLRLPMVYGPGDYQHRLWEYLGRMHDQRPHLALDSVAAQWRACRAYVGDVAQAIALAVETPLGRSAVFHLAETPALSELDWARRIGASCGWTGELHAIPAEYWPESHRCQGNMRQHWELDSTAIRRDLGYVELFNPEDALARTIEWELANPPATPKADSLPYPDEDELVQRWLQSKAAEAS